MVIECCNALLTFAAVLRAQCLLIITLFAIPQFKEHPSFFLVPLLCRHAVGVGYIFLLSPYFCILGLIGKVAWQVFLIQSHHPYFVMNAGRDIVARCCFLSYCSLSRFVGSFYSGEVRNHVSGMTVFGRLVLSQLPWLVRLEGVQIP
jgi:hypothetical protein